MTSKGFMEGEGFLGSFCAFVQHGLLIFRDVSSTDTHQGWGGEESAHAGPDSLYLRVQASVDGAVTVSVYDDESEELGLEGATIFDGMISSESGEFVLHDPNGWISMRVITDTPGPARLRITGNDARMPSDVHFQIWY